MNISEAWDYGRSLLTDTPTPELDARLLLEHVLRVSHSHLIAHGEQSITPAQEKEFRSLISRAQEKEPIPHLLTHAPFFGLDFTVGPDVLIPRPETELLVEAALEWAKPRLPLHIVDVGTGSGCIAVSLARHLPEALIEAVDISARALSIARQNAQKHVPGRIQFHQGDLLAPLLQPPDLIVANLPYVTDAEWTRLDDGVKLYEPAVALRGGSDGLDLVRKLLGQASSKLNVDGALFLEIGWQQGPSALRLARTSFPAAKIELKPDFAGHGRIIAIELG